MTRADDARDEAAHLATAARWDRLANDMQPIMVDAYLALDGSGPEAEAAYAALDAVAEAVRQRDLDRLRELAGEVES